MLKGLQPKLTELGKIKIGCKEATERQSKGGGAWRAPQKLDHFLITTLERDAKGDLKNDAQLMARLAEVTGAKDGKLREIPIAVLSDDIDEIVTAAYCWYDSKRIAARCDGETCTWYRDSKGQPIPEGKASPCNGEHDKLVDDKGKKRFKVHGTLNCVIAAGDARWGGVYKFRTTSRITVEQLYGSLQHLQLLTNGILRGLPLRLVVRPMQVNPTVNGAQVATTVFVVHIELRGVDLSAIQQQAIQIAQSRNANVAQLQAAQAEYRKLLTAPGEDEPEDEQEDVASEFHPGPENGAVKAAAAVAEDAEIVTPAARIVSSSAAASETFVGPTAPPPVAETPKTNGSKPPEKLTPKALADLPF